MRDNDKMQMEMWPFRTDRKTEMWPFTTTDSIIMNDICLE